VFVEPDFLGRLAFLEEQQVGLDAGVGGEDAVGQMIWKAVKVLPVPVAMTSKSRRRPCATASTTRLMALSW
jgi:hypothetical protein